MAGENYVPETLILISIGGIDIRAGEQENRRRQTHQEPLGFTLESGITLYNTIVSIAKKGRSIPNIHGYPPSNRSLACISEVDNEAMSSQPRLLHWINHLEWLESGLCFFGFP